MRIFELWRLISRSRFSVREAPGQRNGGRFDSKAKTEEVRR